MDQKQLAERKLNREYLGNIDKVTFVSNKSNFSETKDGKINDVLRQRYKQRDWLFWFSLAFVSATTLFVLAIIGVQAYINFHGYKVQLIEGTTLQIVVSGIFVQFVGLVGIITRSIWNDKPYLDAGVMNKKE